MVKLIRNGDITQVFDDNNVVIGYVENDRLFAFLPSWDVEEIGAIDHPTEVEGKLKEWKKTQAT